MHLVEILSLLTPFEVNKRKIRIGPQGDGGYVLLDTIPPRVPVFSYGIGTEYRFDTTMAGRGHPVFMFDHTIDQVNCQTGMTWTKQGLGVPSQDGPPLSLLGDHISRFAPDARDMILKIDVEGAEYDWLAAEQMAALMRFSQIAIEIHWLSRLGEPEWQETVGRFLWKLMRNFTIFHVHANNYDGPDPMMVEGLPVPNLIELSLVRTNLVHRMPNATLYPTELDFPNVAGPDKPLWFFPFLPGMSIPTATLCREHGRIRNSARGPDAGTEGPNPVDAPLTGYRAPPPGRD